MLFPDIMAIRTSISDIKHKPERTTFKITSQKNGKIKCVAWGRMGESIRKHIPEGSIVNIGGILQKNKTITVRQIDVLKKAT